MEQCFIVVHDNNTDGMMAYAFWAEEAARKDVESDMNDTVESLKEQGYDPIVLGSGSDSVEVYVGDTSIYYKWDIISSSIR